MTKPKKKKAAKKASPHPPPKPYQATRRRPAKIAPAESLHLVTGKVGTPVPLRFPAEHYARLEAVCARSGVSIERWLDSVISSALTRDERHWKEIDDQDQMAQDVDRTMFARLSQQLRGLRPGTIDLLVREIVKARWQGRTEGRRMLGGRDG